MNELNYKSKIAYCNIRYGVNYSWGLFLRHYNQYVYVNQMTKLSWIGSICIALFFIIGPINEWVVCKLGYTKMLCIATILCPLALMLASISHEVKLVIDIIVAVTHRS